MHQSRTCPHCRARVPVTGARRFDQNLNLLCNHCGKVVFPTDAAGADEIAVALRSRIDQEYSYYSNNKNFGQYQCPIVNNNEDVDD